MEDTLRALQNSRIGWQPIVLILVLMEDTLRDAMKNSSYEAFLQS